MRLRRRLADLVAEVEALTERVAALEGARPTVELVAVEQVDRSEPLDMQRLWGILTAQYSYGYGDPDDGWRGYL